MHCCPHRQCRSKAETFNGTVHAASKVAARSLGRSFAAELAGRGIRVNTLTPGLIDTPLMAKPGIPTAELTQTMRAMVPMEQIRAAIESANAAICLASDESFLMTASEIILAGGMADV